MPKLRDIPPTDRPRERFLRQGKEAVSTSDLVAIILGSGSSYRSIDTVARDITKKYGAALAEITLKELTAIPGIGRVKGVQLLAALALGKRLYEELKARQRPIVSPNDALYLLEELRDKKKEYLVCLYLNARNSLIKKEVISIGTLNASLIHPREVFGPAIELRAASLIIAHNHPSGDVTPSPADQEVLSKLIDCGVTLGIAVIDFLILSQEHTFSSCQQLQEYKGAQVSYVADGLERYRA